MERQQIDAIELIYLLVPNQDEGSIDAVTVFETKDEDGKLTGSLVASTSGFSKLITDLSLPSYIHYDHKSGNLYVCDYDKIISYPIEFDSYLPLVPEQGLTLIEDIECAGLNADKFGNLLYVDKRTKSIRKLKGKDILDLSTS